MPTSTTVPFIDAQQINHLSKYHSFECVPVKYIPKCKIVLESELSRTELMIGCYLINRQYEPETGLGKLETESLSSSR